MSIHKQTLMLYYRTSLGDPEDEVPYGVGSHLKKIITYNRDGDILIVDYLTYGTDTAGKNRVGKTDILTNGDKVDSSQIIHASDTYKIVDGKTLLTGLELGHIEK